MPTDNAHRLRSQSTPGEQKIPVVMQDSPGSDGVGAADGLSSESKFSLADFDKCEKHNQHDLFVSNLTHVFQYCMKDVLETLNSLDMDVLNLIHRVGLLADRVKSDFHQYKDRRAVQRIVAHTAAKDIWSLGFCIANGLPTKDLDKILISQNKEKTSDADCTIDGRKCQEY